MEPLFIQRIDSSHLPWITKFLKGQWGSTLVVSRGRLHHADQLPGFMAVHNDQPAGLITYHIENQDCEIVTLDSLTPGIGIGSKLIGTVKRVAIQKQCKRLWLITTNDNVHAIRFYQKRGFRIAAVHINAMEISRKLKPGIPATGFDAIPIRDEIEFELDL